MTGAAGRRDFPGSNDGKHIGSQSGDAISGKHARLGLAVTRGLLLDLLATGDRAGVEAALDGFARRYRGRWWDAQEETGTSDRAS